MILVTGATGRMGGAVLAHCGVPCRAAMRRPAPLAGARETVRFDLDDPATFAAALAGCDALFLMRPPTTTRRRPFDLLMQAARAEGVGHVICASVWGAGNSRVLPHRHMEAAVRDSGLACSFLRPADFMQNLADIHAGAIRDRGELALPAGDGRAAFLDVEDVGHAAAAILADRARHAGRAYDLTGPAALCFDDVAWVLSGVLNRRIVYRPVSVPRFVIGQVRRGRPLATALVMAALYSVQRFGRAAPVSADFRRLTGRASGTFQAFATRERASFG